ncbi:uncharacterized protein [Patagioenas fasciata]|uniref:uncharacterized protein n=1 Tax=Patagioenas fasciata TaxID=372321 RepID=UPI003A99827E
MAARDGCEGRPPREQRPGRGGSSPAAAGAPLPRAGPAAAAAAGAGGGPGAAAPLAGAGRSPCCPRAVAVLPPGGSGGVPLVAPAVPRLKILLTPRWDRDRRQFRPGLLALVLSTPISPGFLQLLCPLDPSYRFCSDGEHLTVLCMAKMMRTLDRKSLPSAAFLSPLGSDNSPGIATAAPTAPVSRQQHRRPRYRDSSTNSPGIATGSSDGAGIATAAPTALIL